jgi:hypothetical protein
MTVVSYEWRQSYEQLLQTSDYILDRAESMKEQGAETQPQWQLPHCRARGSRAKNQSQRYLSGFG